MAATKEKVCSLALIELGMSPISSFNDNDPGARICEAIWTDVSRELVSSYPWRFSIKKVELGRLVDPPLNEYSYQYQLPGDLLRLRALYNSDNAGATTKIGYQLYGKQIYTDYSNVYIDYQAYVEPVDWPYWFVEFAVMALASKLAPKMTEESEVIKRTQVNAYGLPSDNWMGGLFGKARRLDSSQQPSRLIRTFSLLAARQR